MQLEIRIYVDNKRMFPACINQDDRQQDIVQNSVALCMESRVIQFQFTESVCNVNWIKWRSEM